MKGYDVLFGSAFGWCFSFKQPLQASESSRLKRQPSKFYISLHRNLLLRNKFPKTSPHDDATPKLFPWQKINIFSISSYKGFMKNVCECIIDVVLQVIGSRELLLPRHELLFRLLTFFQPKFNFVNVIPSRNEGFLSSHRFFGYSWILIVKLVKDLEKL